MPAEPLHFLDGSKVYFVEKSIRLASRRLKIWTQKLHSFGGKVLDNPASEDINVVLLGDLAISNETKLPDAPLVSVTWLEACLAEQKRLPIKDFLLSKPEDNASAEERLDPVHGPLYKFQPWLGFWEPEFDCIHNVTELVLQAKFSIQNSINEPLVERLLELHKFEAAVMDERGSAESDNGDFINHKASSSSCRKSLSKELYSEVSIEALQYARAASIARACAFKIGPHLQDDELPFVGPASARVIRDILLSGSCPELDAFRVGQVAPDSKGAPRPRTQGGDVRKLFKKLPGVGVATAWAWWDAGFRSFEDLQAHAEVKQENGLVTRTQFFSLRHRVDLLDVCPPEDIQEMRATLAQTLHALTGEEWRVWLVGGARRSTASHDADFVVSRPNGSPGPVVFELVDSLISRGRMVSQEEGMCQVQQGRMKTDAQPRAPSDSGDHNLRADRHDRVLGIYITGAGKHRRMDIILPSWEQVPFCLMSWTGSKQYNRFLRQHAINRGMALSAHSLTRKSGGAWCLVPEEESPLGRDKGEFWPPGWRKDRKIRTEADIFELLGLPYREPWERNCP